MFAKEPEGFGNLVFNRLMADVHLFGNLPDGVSFKPAFKKNNFPLLRKLVDQLPDMIQQRIIHYLVRGVAFGFLVGHICEIGTEMSLGPEMFPDNIEGDGKQK
jgi:hypothetical protein